MAKKVFTDESLKALIDQTKAYTDSAAATVKDELLNGAGEAYDTLKELGDLINENVNAIEALETVASGKADANHNHDDKYYTETEMDSILANKADVDHTHDLSAYETKENAQAKYDEITSAKSDWNQNDETAIDYIKNRTHWVDYGDETCLIPHQSFDYPYGESSSTGYTYLTVDSTVELSLDKTYKVIYNGVTYENCKCKEGFSSGGSPAIVVPVGSDQHQTDAVCITRDGDAQYRVDVGYNVISQTDSDGNRTIDVYEVSETVHQLDEKYISDTIARKSEVDEVSNRVAAIENGSSGGGDAVQSNWSENDSTSSSYVKNRTHWLEIATEVLLAETTVNQYDALPALSEVSYDDVPECIVVFDGTKYNCTRYIGETGEYCYGNLDTMGFVIGSMVYSDGLGDDPEDTYDWWITLRDDLASTSHTLKIEVETGDVIYHQLPTNYLPTIPIAKGGTGATNLKKAKENLGIPESALEVAYDNTSGVLDSTNVQDAIDESHTTLKSEIETSQSSSMVYTNQTVSDALTGYAKADDLASLENSVSTQIQTASDIFNDNLTGLQEQMVTSDSAMQSQLTDINEKIQEIDTAVEDLTKGNMNVTNVVVSGSLSIGKLKITSRENGSVDINMA